MESNVSIIMATIKNFAADSSTTTPDTINISLWPASPNLLTMIAGTPLSYEKLSFEKQCSEIEFDTSILFPIPWHIKLDREQ